MRGEVHAMPFLCQSLGAASAAAAKTHPDRYHRGFFAKGLTDMICIQ
jgi:hypothetical protein